MIDGTTGNKAPNGGNQNNFEIDDKNSIEKMSENSPIENHSRADLTKNLEESLVVEINEKQLENDSRTKGWLQTFIGTHKAQIRCIRTCVLNFLYGGYFAWATIHFIQKPKSDNYDECDMQWCDGYGMLLSLTVLVYTCLFYFNVIKPLMGKCFGNAIKPIKTSCLRLFSNCCVKLICVGLILAALGVFIAYDTRDSRERLRSLVGIVILYGFGYIFSVDRSKIKWRTVISGIIFQFFLGIFCIRMEIGRKVFECLGKKTKVFFAYALEGSAFVYGTLVTKFEIFAFSVLSVIFFFSLIISILYYYGAMQWIIQQLGSIFQTFMGTTICEGVIVAGNIFLGQTESPLLIRPYIKYLTASEMHVVMASGFATVSGTVLAAYIKFGAEPSHLITSTVMAAPATLAFAKLIYPETEVSRTSAKDISMEESKDKSVLDAASNGAFAAIALIAGITANLIAFVAFMKFMNGIVGWLGMLIGHDYVSFEWFFGKLFTPLAYVIGIPLEDCDKIGTVIGNKIVINEFVAFESLGKMKERKEIMQRSAAIATFAICGFANFSSLGMVIGNLGTMCPEKRSLITTVSIRALVSGSIICFLNASIAGLLISDDSFV